MTLKTIKEALISAQDQLAQCKPDTGYSKNHTRVAIEINKALTAIRELRESVDVGELREAIDDMETGIKQSEKCEPPYTLIAVERDQMKTWKKMFKTLAELMGDE